MKKIGIVSVVVMAVLFVFTAVSFAADEAAEQKVESAPVANPGESVIAPVVETKSVSVKQMTTDEIVSDIKATLDEYEEISNFVPGLKKTTDRSGKVNYTFAGIMIETLDRVRLEKLYIRVHQEMTRVHTENINRQLDTVRRIQRAGNIPVSGAPKSPVTPHVSVRVPSALPASYTVPRPPRPPVAPPAPPKR